MKKTILGSAIVLSLISGSAMADRLFLSGKAGGGYDALADAPVQVLNNAWIEIRESNRVNGTNANSVDNINAVLKDPRTVAYAQGDVYANVKAANPGKLMELGIVGQECIFMVTSNPDIPTFSKFVKLSSRAKIAASGGSQRSVELMKEAIRGFRVRGKNFVPGVDGAVAAVRAVQNGQANVAVFVQYPDATAEVFKMIDSDPSLSYVPVQARELLRYEVDGFKPYSPAQVRVDEAKLSDLWKKDAATMVETACTPIVMVTGAADLDVSTGYGYDAETAEYYAEDQLAIRDAIQEKLAADPNAFVPQTDGWKAKALSFTMMAADKAGNWAEAAVDAASDAINE